MTNSHSDSGQILPGVNSPSSHTITTSTKSQGLNFLTLEIKKQFRGITKKRKNKA
jgi:hypothetical protein